MTIIKALRRERRSGREREGMDDDPGFTQLFQLPLIDFKDTKSGTVELYPAVWSALEALISPDAQARHAGLDYIIQLDAARLSPLVAYTLATRLDDPDIGLRARIVMVLSRALVTDEQGWIAPDSLRLHLKNWLAQMRTREIYALMQLLDHDEALATPVAILLNACSYAGNHLAEILTNRTAPLPIRVWAATMIGRVGYIDAIPVLERSLIRLESRLNGQQAMSFASVEGGEEIELLPSIRHALSLLRAP